MIQDEQTKKLVDLLALEEELIGVLYHQYSLLFSDSDFWTNLSKEEFIHQSWVLSLANSENDIRINRDRFTINSLETMIQLIKKYQEEKDLNQLKALSYSLDIEKALLENEFFKIFDSDVPEVKKIFKELEIATKNHLQRVQEELNNIKMTS